MVSFGLPVPPSRYLRTTCADPFACPRSWVCPSFTFGRTIQSESARMVRLTNRSRPSVGCGSYPTSTLFVPPIPRKRPEPLSRPSSVRMVPPASSLLAKAYPISTRSPLPSVGPVFCAVAMSPVAKKESSNSSSLLPEVNFPSLFPPPPN